MEAIVVSNLTKDYGKFRAVNSISFSINEGERFGFLGPNGAGKTTTIRSILGLLQKTDGTVSILGKEINPLKNVEYRNQIGYLPGELGLPKEKNGKQILQYIAGLYSDAVNWTYVEQIATRLQLDMNRPVGELSKGNKQKIGVIATLMLPFRILILDEPS